MCCAKDLEAPAESILQDLTQAGRREATKELPKYPEISERKIYTLRHWILTCIFINKIHTCFKLFLSFNNVLSACWFLSPPQMLLFCLSWFWLPRSLYALCGEMLFGATSIFDFFVRLLVLLPLMNKSTSLCLCVSSRE